MPYAGKHDLGTARDGSSRSEVSADVIAGPAAGVDAEAVPVLAPAVELVGEYQGSGLLRR